MLEIIVLSATGLTLYDAGKMKEFRNLPLTGAGFGG